MATEAITVSLRRRHSPSLEEFLPFFVDLSYFPLVRTLASISAEIVSCFRGVRFFFQRRNSRSLIRKIEVLLVLFEYLAADNSGWDDSTWTLMLCFNELYLLLHRSKLLLHYCAQSSKLWLLLQNPSLSDFFHDLSRDILTLLDVFPLNTLHLSEDIREQIELLHQQSSKVTSSLFLDINDELLRHRLYSFLDGFDKGHVPNSEDLRSLFVEKLRITDPKSFRAEIEFLEEEILNQDYCNLEPTRSVIKGFVDITRYCMFLLYEFDDDDDDDDLKLRNDNHLKKKQRICLMAEEIKDTFTTLPTDFLCSISLSLMNDPVIVSTGQTYDRSSIVKWIHQEGHHCTCPKTGQKLVNKSIVPNRALKKLITCWCAATGTDFSDSVNESSHPLVLQTRASVEATKAMVLILIQNIADDRSELAQTVAAREIRLLAKTENNNRALIGEAGAISHLSRLLKSQNAVLQNHSVTALLNLSLCDENRGLIMEENDCLESIVSVVASGLTLEARGNAAATLFSLSVVHGYKKRIANADGCIESLVSLSQSETVRAKKDAVNALHGIWVHPDNCSRMINLGGVSAVVGALMDKAVAEKAVVVLAKIANHLLGAETIGTEESAVEGLIELMRCGTPRGKEDAVATLLQLCVNGGAVVMEKVVRAPGITGLTKELLLTGTDRAKQKASSLLALVRKGCENAAMMRSGINTQGSFRTHVSLPINISVSVL